MIVWLLVGSGGMDPYDSPLRSPLVDYGDYHWGLNRDYYRDPL